MAWVTVRRGEDGKKRYQGYEMIYNATAHAALESLTESVNQTDSSPVLRGGQRRLCGPAPLLTTRATAAPLQAHVLLQEVTS